MFECFLGELRIRSIIVTQAQRDGGQDRLVWTARGPLDH